MIRPEEYNKSHIEVFIQLNTLVRSFWLPADRPISQLVEAIKQSKEPYPFDIPISDGDFELRMAGNDAPNALLPSTQTLRQMDIRPGARFELMPIARQKLSFIFKNMKGYRARPGDFIGVARDGFTPEIDLTPFSSDINIVRISRRHAQVRYSQQEGYVLAVLYPAGVYVMGDRNYEKGHIPLRAGMDIMIIDVQFKVELSDN